MCATCGCSADAVIRRYGPGHDHEHPEHGHPEHGHAAHDHAADGHAADSAGVQSRTVVLQQKVLAKNDEIAARNRDWLRSRGVFAVNLMSAPGAGKTTLLERTARDLVATVPISVIEGDQETELDAARIRAAGCQVVQINTGVGCHLDAAMVGEALRVLDPAAGTVVVIENVGNLVCPALFDLGEQTRVVLASVTEGADKPAKYPHMFRGADLVLLSKTDLLPYLDFDVSACTASLRQVSPDALTMRLSAITGDGMQDWYDWLGRRSQAVTPADPARRPPPAPARS
jgi:hydrogenase nickel incorporation protein HypB